MFTLTYRNNGWLKIVPLEVKFSNNGWLKVVPLAIISFILASCGAGKTTVSGSKASTTLEDDIIQYGRQYLGKPYRYAGKGPNAFDCSGYTSFVFKKFGYKLNASSAGQDKQTPTIAERKELRKGDLVFFEGNRKNGRVGHVGIVTEAFANGHFKFIHSSTSDGVIISSSREPYYASRYIRGGRVLEKDASYVTRRNSSADKKPTPSYSVAAIKDPVQAEIPEVTPQNKTTDTSITASQTNKNPENETIILVQTDPRKNAPLTNRQPITHGGSQSGNTPQYTKSDMVMREEKNSPIPTPPKNHTVQMGETLYSISRLYGCTVEQLQSWNPQIKSVLKTGESLLIYTDQPE